MAYVPDQGREERYAVHSVPTISVIERSSESYSEYHERMKREERGKKVPFGFARALLDDEEES